MPTVKYNDGYTVGEIVTVTDLQGATVKEVMPSLILAGADGVAYTPAAGLPTAAPALPASTDRSGTATTTSGGLNVPANAARKSLVGQNIGANNIGFNEQGGTAAIGTAGTYTVGPGISFSISTNKLVNFVSVTGPTAVTMTET